MIHNDPHVYYRRSHKISRSRLMPAKYSWLDGKPGSGPSRQDFEDLQSIRLSAASRVLDLKPEEAFTLVEQALNGHRRTKVACLGMLKRTTVDGTMLKRLIPFQVLNELDKEFFRSTLKGNISLGWSDLPAGVFSRTVHAGQYGNPRIRIELSPELYWHRGPHHIVAALIHQMVHAYYLQCCGYRDRSSSGSGHDLSHEEPFWALLNCIGEHLDPLREILGKDLEVFPQGDHDRLRKDYDCRCRMSSAEPKVGGSACYREKNRLDSLDIQNWRNHAVATTRSLRDARNSQSAETQKNDRGFPRNVFYLDTEGRESPPKNLELGNHPGEAYVFLRFDDRCYPVARSAIVDLAALTSSPYYRDKFYLEFPPETSEGEFQFFYLFLAHGVYPPSVKEINGSFSFHERADQGPPMIQPFDGNATARLHVLIVAYRLGLTLRYKPFCDHVRQGLSMLSGSAEDPVIILELIYCDHGFWNKSTGSSRIKLPDPKLREWVRSWLSTNLYYTDPVLYGVSYKNNLGVVRHHSMWRERYGRLKDRSSELRDDDKAAEVHLKSRYGISSVNLSVKPPTPAEQQQALHRVVPTTIQPPINMAGSYQFPVTPWQTHRGYEPTISTTVTPDFPDLSSLHTSLPVEYAEDPRGVKSHLLQTPEQFNALARVLRREQQQLQGQRQNQSNLSAAELLYLEEMALRQALSNFCYTGVPGWRPGQ
ncbi:MAG: hypothetical protein Q9218_005808 [Villophora microphyllina]